uniref:Cytidylate kinase n=1 Tax=Eptatretus burgeri TaxID=7764 RepID=A0A8C4N1M0_EPTBU
GHTVFGMTRCLYLFGKTVITNFIFQAMTNIMELDSSKSSFLIDGFPRNEDNVKGWNKHMEDKANVKFVLFFDCDLEICKKRCLDRSQSSGRVDDNEESLNKRIQTYLESSKPIIDQYEKEGKVRRVDASGSVDEVTYAVDCAIDN